MKKATMASLLAVSAFTVAPGLLSFHAGAFAQLPGAQGQVTMPAEEFAVYDDAVNKKTTPQTQAPALEAYLAKYPQSSVKTDVLTRIMLDYSQFDHPKAITAADAVLQVTPDNLQAYVIEVAYRREAADAAGVDPATKQSRPGRRRRLREQGPEGRRDQAEGHGRQDLSADQGVRYSDVLRHNR